MPTRPLQKSHVNGTLEDNTRSSSVPYLEKEVTVMASHLPVELQVVVFKYACATFPENTMAFLCSCRAGYAVALRFLYTRPTVILIFFVPHISQH
jgi:hypothetical protein